jgi:hypothetical protein
MSMSPITVLRYCHDVPTNPYASDKTPPTTLTATIKKTPRTARESVTRTVAIAPFFPLLLALVEADPAWLAELGAVGTFVPVADARHELATEDAVAVEALLFTVPLPAKLHDWALRLFAS